MQLASLPYPEPDYYSWQEDALNSISLPDAWEIAVGSTDFITVGVLDSGIQADHPALYDLVDRERSRDFTTWTDHGYVYPYGLEDPNGHGTHVSGIIATNGTGIAGSCLGISLVSLQVFGGNSGQFSSVRYAVDYAKYNNIPILNYSGGGSYDEFSELPDMLTAIQNYSGLFVCSAGNDGSNNDYLPYYPSNYTSENYGFNNIVSVGALDNNDQRASFPNWSSNYGAASVDLFAPGTGIASTYPEGLCPNRNCDPCLFGGETYIAEGYHTNSGTSFSAPYVTGVAALIKSLHPNMTGVQLKIALRNSVDILPQLIGLCNTGGKINAYKAVNYIPIVGSIDITFDGTNITTVQDPNVMVGEVLAGKFHLFINGTYIVAGMGVYTTPINHLLFPSSDNLYCSAVPAGISHYITQTGNDIYTEFGFFVPGNDPDMAGLRYWRKPFRFIVNDSGAQIYYGGDRFTPLDLLNSNDKKRIYVSTYW